MGILPIPRCHKAFKSKRVKSRRCGHLARTTHPNHLLNPKSVREYALFAWLVQQRLMHPLP